MTVIAMRETENVVRRVAESVPPGTASPSLELVASERQEEGRDPDIDPELHDGASREVEA